MSKATQKEGLGKDALLTRLGGWFGYYFNINDVASGISQENGLLPEERQAYAQLVKIVEGYFKDEVPWWCKHCGEIVYRPRDYAVNEPCRRCGKYGKTTEEPPDTQAEQSTESVKNTAQKPVEQSGEVAGFLADLREVVDGSGGVDGWHLNDDIVTWEELNITVDRIDAFLQQKQGSKRVVTRAWIEKELNAHLRLEDEALRDYVHVIADIIVEIFTAFGIEVVEK